jgi:quinol monooxygenase YgiN
VSSKPGELHSLLLWTTSGNGILGGRCRGCATTLLQRRTELFLATTTVEDFDRFLRVFSTKGAEKRKQHGSKGATVFRDPNEDDRVWMLYDWDEEGLQSFLSDPEVPAIVQEAGYKRRLQPAEFGGQYDS